MAKIITTSPLSAAIIKANEHLCFYRMNGQWQMRRKSSLKGKRVKNDPAFQLTMVYAGLLAQASGIASQVFQQIPKEDRVKGLYKKIVGVAMKNLKSGQETEAIKEMLTALFLLPPSPCLIRSVKPIKSASELLQSSRTPAGQFSNRFYGDLQIFYALRCLINNA